MKKISFAVPSNKKDFSYIGFNFKENKSIFVFPCQYFARYSMVGDDLHKHEAKKILELIVNYKSEAQSGDLFGAGSLYNSMIWLLEDYLENGYYKEWLSESKISGRGKVDWKKTIKNNDIIFDGESIVYQTLFRKMRKNEENQIITEIYKCCLAWCVENLGWIYDLYNVEKSIFSLSRHQNVKFMINFLKARLTDNFLSYKQKLFSCLLKILKAVEDKDASNFFYANETEFEYIFERLINKVFGNLDVRQYYTNAVYQIEDMPPINSSKLRPDTIMQVKEEQLFCIIDAKYYNFGYSKNEKDLPPSSSITKQLAYADFIYKKWLDENSKVKSAFILPYSAKKTEDVLRRVGWAFYGETTKDEEENVEKKISVFLIDLKTLIDISHANDQKSILDLRAKFLKLI